MLCGCGRSHPLRDQTHQDSNVSSKVKGDQSGKFSIGFAMTLPPKGRIGSTLDASALCYPSVNILVY